MGRRLSGRADCPERRQEVSKRVIRADLRAAGICAAGARRWLKDRGVLWPDFLEKGVSLAWLEEQDDENANRVATAARDRLNRQGVI